jgi:hypothetical protein
MLPPEAGTWNRYIQFELPPPNDSSWEAATAALAESADAPPPE